MNCTYCDNPVLNEQKITYDNNHVACRAEYDRRTSVALCVRCGENSTILFVCRDCGSNDCDNVKPYKDYPGPD